jgi:hypothetical protein
MMRTKSKVAIGGIATTLAIVLAGSVALTSVDVREIGRSDPKRAAHYRLPWFNFFESYSDGAVLGVVVGSTKAEAIEAAERAGLTVAPGSWGDNRAGGASLYDRPTLLATMLEQPVLDFYDEADLRRGMNIYFRGDRVTRIDVYYINTESI